jgi:predicted PurR-regulated permease PerM
MPPPIVPLSSDPPSAVAEAGAVPRPRGMPSWVGKALLAIAVVFLLQAAKAVLMPLTVAILLTFLLFGPVRMLTRIGVPPALGALVVVAAVLGAVGVVASALAEPAYEWVERLPQNMRQLGDVVDEVRSNIPGMEPPRRAPRSAQPPADPVKERLANEGVTFTRAAVARFGEAALSVGMAVILLYFLLASEYQLLSRTVQAIPGRRQRALVLGGVRQAQREVGRYLATAGLINMALGAITGFVVMQLGLPNPLLWGAMVAVLNFVPYIGPLVGASMLVLVGLLTWGVSWSMLFPAGAYLALHGIESNLVTPLVVGRRLRLHPMAVFLSVMVWAWIWGVAGAFIAVPMLLVIRAACRRVPDWRLLYHYLNDSGSKPASLRSLIATRIEDAAAAPRRA